VGLRREGGSEGKHWMLCGAVVASRGGCQMKEPATGKRKGIGQGEMSKMSGLPLDASFFEFKAW